MEKPLVSVIIPTHNRSNKILRAIKSVLNQTYKYIEIIIVDDYSNDNTTKIIHKFIQKNHLGNKIKLILNKDNKGNAESRNIGIRHANGRYIAFLDDDDIWLPSKLEKQVNEILKIDAKVCFCGSIWMEGNRVVKKTLTKSKLISFQNGGPTSTWLLHKSVFKKIGYFDNSFPSNVDGEYLVRLNRNFKTCFVNEYLYTHFYHRNQISSNIKNKITGFEKLFNKHKKILNKYEKSQIFFNLSIFYLLDNKKRFDYLLNSLNNSKNVNNFALLILFLFPTYMIKFLINKLLNFMNYPNSFAGRYR